MDADFPQLLVVAVLVWAARKPKRGWREWNRTSRLDDEIREMRSAADKEVKGEYQRLLTAAEQDAEKIAERSRREIDGMACAAQQVLKPRVTELSVQMAEERIRGEISGAGRERIFSQFVRTLGGDQ